MPEAHRFGRLERLTRLLESEDLNPALFDMSTWSEEVRNGQHDCGYAACAIGWATTIPEFAQAGLRLEVIGIEVYPQFGERGYSPFVALAAFFGISNDEARDLFSNLTYGNIPSKQITPTMVAAKIRQLIGGAP